MLFDKLFECLFTDSYLFEFALVGCLKRLGCRWKIGFGFLILVAEILDDDVCVFFGNNGIEGFFSHESISLRSGIVIGGIKHESIIVIIFSKNCIQFVFILRMLIKTKISTIKHSSLTKNIQESTLSLLVPVTLHELLQALQCRRGLVEPLPLLLLDLTGKLRLLHHPRLTFIALSLPFFDTLPFALMDPFL